MECGDRRGPGGSGWAGRSSRVSEPGGKLEEPTLGRAEGTVWPKALGGCRLAGLQDGTVQANGH